MNIEKQKTFIIRFAYIALVLGIGYVVIKYALPFMMPFIIGLFISASLRPIIDLIEKKIKVRRSIVAVIILLAFYSLIVWIGIIFGIKIVAFLEEVFDKLPRFYSSTLVPALNDGFQNTKDRFPGINPYLESVSTSINDSIFSFIKSASTNVLGMITGIASRIPIIIIKLILTIVSSIFFSVDYYRIWGFVMKQFNEKHTKMLIYIKENVIATMGKFIKAYSLLITITFIELSIGFALLGVKAPLLIGCIVAIIDILPILGSGSVLIPWAIISFLFHKPAFGIGMLVLYAVITVIRQILEPKVVGNQIGLHPVITLICMFVGAQLMGVLGLFLLPISATIIKKMNDDGAIHLLK